MMSAPMEVHLSGLVTHFCRFEHNRQRPWSFRDVVMLNIVQRLVVQLPFLLSDGTVVSLSHVSVE